MYISTIARNMQVVKRNGSREDVSFDKISDDCNQSKGLQAVNVLLSHKSVPISMKELLRPISTSQR
jgi:hypothetical protein